MTYVARLKSELEAAGFTFRKEGDLWRCQDGEKLVSEAVVLSECVERAAQLLGM